jgi:hypothetical protein
MRAMRSNRRGERAARRCGRAKVRAAALAPFAAFAALAFGIAWPAGAGAQVRWDLGVLAGAADRIASGSAPARSPGPSGEIHAHIALYPMLRVGPYAAFDLSPTSGLRARSVYAAGLRVKVTPPWLRAPWRAWGFLGFGGAYAYAPGARSLEAAATLVPELPLGVGVGRRIRRGWEACAELGVRWNLAGFAAAARPEPPVEVFVGNDLLAVSLSVGVNFGD